jgi:hypothetical protein
MKKEEIIQADTVSLLRAVMKISSALNNLDELTSSKYNRFKFKVEALKWDAIMAFQLSTIMKSMIDENDALMVDVLNKINETDSNIKYDDDTEKNSDKKNLLLLYSKLRSALNDIAEIKELNKVSYYPSVIVYATIPLVKIIEKQHNFILSKDKLGIEIKDIVEFYDKEGKSIMYTSI